MNDVLLFGSIDLFIAVNPPSERSCQLCILNRNFKYSQFVVENRTVADIALGKKKCFLDWKAQFRESDHAVIFQYILSNSRVEVTEWRDAGFRFLVRRFGFSSLPPNPYPYLVYIVVFSNVRWLSVKPSRIEIKDVNTTRAMSTSWKLFG